MTRSIILAAILAAGLSGCVETTASAPQSSPTPEAISCTLPAEAKWHGEKLTSVDQLKPPYQDGDRNYAAAALAGDPVYQAWVTDCLGASL